MKNKRYSVAIADSSHIVNRGLVAILTQIPYIVKIVRLNTHAKLSVQIKEHNPDILILNPLLLSLRGTTPLRQFLNLEYNPIIVSFISTPIGIEMAEGYSEQLSIADSEDVILGKINKLIHSTGPQEENEDNVELGRREKEVLIGVARGLANKQIADQLCLSIHTVISHRRNITRKLDIHTTSGLTVYAIMNKLIQMDDLVENK